MEIFRIIVLGLSGLLLIYAGTTRVIKPLMSFCIQAYSQNPALKLEGEVDVFNEMRGAGASLALAGIMIILGTFLPDFRLTSHVVAIVIFVGFAVGRVLSSNLDGKPNKDLVQGTVSEIVLGVLNVVAAVTILL